MEQTAVRRFFLGANSCQGFYSLYRDLWTPANGDFLWIIKGGPGCGKSSLMKSIGAAMEQQGLPVEYIHCSGDPDSLDAVWLPTLGEGYVDGTAPHGMDAVHPAAASLYLDLGEYYDAAALRPALSEIIALTDEYQQRYRRAYDLLAAAVKAAPDTPWLADEGLQTRLRKKVSGIAAREFSPANRGSRTRRFLSAITAQGEICFFDTAAACCSRLYLLDNERGLAAPFLTLLDQQAEAVGQSRIYCPDPLDPTRPQALLFPGLSLGYLAVDSTHPCPYAARHLRLDALVDHAAVLRTRSAFRQSRKLSARLLTDAITQLAEAKSLHDQLEAVYNPHVDFEGIYALARRHQARLLQSQEENMRHP